ncbi:MAG: hypothetical protein V4534_08875 [Myxococcota bacterium]
MIQLDFLGAEFLTWLYFRIEELPQVTLGKKVSLKPLNGEDRKVTISTPNLDDSGEVLQAIRSGYHVETLALEYVIDERVHAFTLNATDGTISGVRSNGHGKSTGEDQEADILLRMANLDEIEEILMKLFGQFMEVRLGQTFVSQEIKSIREFVLQGLQAKLVGPLPTWRSAMNEAPMQA